MLLIAGAACLATTDALAQSAPTPNPDQLALDACRTANGKLDAEIDVLVAKAKSDGKMSPAETTRYQQLEAGIRARRIELARDSFTLAGCRTMTTLFQAEKTKVLKMAETAAARNVQEQADLAECLMANGKLFGAIDALFVRAKRDGMISPAEATRFQQLEARMLARVDGVSRKGFTLADCRAMHTLF